MSSNFIGVEEEEFASLFYKNIRNLSSFFFLIFSTVSSNDFFLNSKLTVFHYLMMHFSVLQSINDFSKDWEKHFFVSLYT